MYEVEVAVIGAGAAGLAAARRLGAGGAEVVVLEAGARVGGLGHTVLRGGLPLDLGCGWLHDAAENRCREVFQHELGLPVDRTPPPWGKPAIPAGFPVEAQADYQREMGALEARLEAAARLPQDRPAADLLEPGGRWNPLLEAFSNAYNGAPFTEVSVHDYGRYREGDGDWRLPQGYGAALAAAAAGLPIRLETAVNAVAAHAGGFRLQLAGGAQLSARQVICTLPSTLLAQGAIRFDPEPPGLLAAAAHAPLGFAAKGFHAITGDARALAEPESLLYGAVNTARTAIHHIRPFGRPYVESYLGGAVARELEGAGEAALLAFARDELVSRLGARWASRLEPLAASNWSGDPLAGGAYSHALPGFVEARAVLGASFGGLHFAGEAGSRHFFSTAHGAWETGERAADAALAALRAG